MTIWQPVYEWHWKREGYSTMKAHNPAQAAILKRAAARHGGTVKRVQTGLRMKRRLATEISKIFANQ